MSFAGRIYKYALLLLSIVAFARCQKEDIHNGRVPLAGVDGVYLYKDEVEILYAVQGQGVDSAAFFEEYIANWVTDALFYNKALDNVASTNDIEKMVESYRKSLILSIYQDKLINQHLVPEISQEEVFAFYKQNPTLFELEEPLIKGLVLKLPLKSPKMNDVRRWCMRREAEDLEKLEKYSINNAVFYDCFIEDWTTMGSVVAHTPLTLYQLNERLSRKDIIEFSDDGYVYFIGADSIIPKGGQKPLDMVKPEITELLVNSTKAKFIKERKHTLYIEAQNRGEIEIMNEQASKAAQ